MQIDSSVFIKSSPSIGDCPKEDVPEYAFIGRSNVGKSSLINMLTAQKKLAKTSAAPGKTRLINHFMINNEWYLVDLPGYGYAKIAQKQRQQLARLIDSYILKRSKLECVFVLLDSRHQPQESDLNFMHNLGENQIPFAMVFTKIDKLSKGQLDKNINLYRKKMLDDWEFLPEIFLTSATNQKGREAVLNYIKSINSEIKGSAK